MEVYFDNSATTKPYEEIIDIMVDVMRNYYGNPSSAHALGIKAEKKINECRDIIAKAINCTRDEIIFTSGGSESNNFLLKGFIKPGSHIITSAIEHPSIINTCREIGISDVRVTYLKVDEHGKVHMDELEKSIEKDTQIVSIMHVNNEIGTIQDIETIGKIIKEKSNRVKFHVDAVQGFGKFAIDVQKCGIDLMSASGHKIHGPRGSGFAYVRKNLMPRPLISGGGQERKFRSGTENLAAIAGFAEATRIFYNNKAENYNKVLAVKSYFIEKLRDFDGIRINSEGNNFSPYILSVSFSGVRGEVLLHLLEEEGIYVSTGSACSAREKSDSHVLAAIGLKKDEIKGTIRFSFCEYNTKNEVDYTIEVLKKSLEFLRRAKR